MRRFLFSLWLLTSACCVNAAIWYVSPNGKGLRDGTSWANAAPTIDAVFPPSNYAPSPLANQPTELELSSHENITADIYTITGLLIQQNVKEPFNIAEPGVYVVKYFENNNFIAVKKVVITK